MPAPRELQTAFRRAVLDRDDGAVALVEAEIEPSWLAASERLAIYRNNVFAALTDSLRETFPVVRRLVDERFFSYAAHEFIRAHPPFVPALAEYGGAFGDFLAEFPPCRELVYLADVARLEWAMTVVATVSDEPPLSADALAAIGADQAAQVGFRLQPTYRYLTSPWPIDRIWRANQENADEETIDLCMGGVRLEIRRQNETVVYRTMSEAEFEFRKTLSERIVLGEALERAFAADPEFPAGDALANLFREGAVVTLIQRPAHKERT